ncbi:hypothetical protein L6452_21931 [Arctium lappa]|uniref:Uncharacterized protein n=1 Tax=Arctium lappa TaxID=4217 RepID=A0ACB9AZ50_ARCLA|nr:hypothetical protein L6452_21931 [Arctium lappa]
MQIPIELHVCIDVLDEVGIVGGASGVSGGLLHPYSPKDYILLGSCNAIILLGKCSIFNSIFGRVNKSVSAVNPLWRAVECWEESLRLLSIAETTICSKELGLNYGELAHNSNGFIARRRGILRPAVNLKNMSILNDALYVACGTLAKDMSATGLGEKEINFHKRSIGNLLELEELSGRLSLRTYRDVTTHLHSPDNIREEVPDHSPSILSDAWLAIQNPRNLYLGST